MLNDDSKCFDSKSHNLLVVGTARNCSKHIKADILKIQCALQDFNQVHWLVIESDSEDNTLEKLNELTSEVTFFRYISLGVLSKEYPLRTERIAFCRNTYLKELRENQLYQEVSFVVVMDLDGINHLITAQTISSCFARDDWGVCTANQLGNYYDIWALRHKLWSPNDCWQQFNLYKQYGLSRREARFAAVRTKQIIIPKDMDWIEVDSAFGGMAIYRRHVLDNGKYIGIRKDGTAICEHVFLHQQITKQGFKIFINPAFINGTRTNLQEKMRKKHGIRNIYRLIKYFSGQLRCR